MFFSLSKSIVVLLVALFFATCFSTVSVTATEVGFGVEVGESLIITPFPTVVDLPTISGPGAPVSANVPVNYWASCDTQVSFAGATSFSCSTLDVYGNPVAYTLGTVYGVSVTADKVVTPSFSGTPSEINAFSTLVGNGDVQMTVTVEATSTPTDKAEDYSAGIDILVAAN